MSGTESVHCRKCAWNYLEWSHENDVVYWQIAATGLVLEDPCFIDEPDRVLIKDKINK